MNFSSLILFLLFSISSCQEIRVKVYSPLAAIVSGPNIQIETIPDGSGLVINSLTLEVGNNFTLYAIKRNPSGGFLANEPVSWTQSGTSGSLTTNGAGESSEFSPTSPGVTEVILSVGGQRIRTATITVVPAANPPLNVSNLVISSITTSGFTATLDFTGGSPGQSHTLYYCNSTQAPGCNPNSGSSTPMTVAGSSYTATVAGLLNPGDDYNIRIFSSDAVTVTGSPMDSTFSLLYNNLVVSNLTVSAITTSGFSASLNFTGGSPSQTHTLYYCNESASTGCNPQAGSSAVMTVSGSNYTVAISGLTNPGDVYNVRAISTDSVSVSGSPLNTTATLAYSSLSVSNLVTSNITSSGFTATLNFSGGTPSQSHILYYCNNSVSSGCNPQSGSSVAMSVSGSTYTVAVNGLNPLDTYNIRAVSSDTLTVSGSPLNTSATLLKLCSGAYLTNTPYAAGTGTDADPFIICTATQLTEINNNTADLNKTFKLEDDLDFSGITFNGIAVGLDVFEGKFFGNNKTISNLSITEVGGEGGAGLFNFIYNSYISDFTIVDGDVLSNSLSEVGMIAGYCEYSTFENVKVIRGNVSTSNNAGLAMGGVHDCLFKDIDLEGTVSVSASGAGGFAGFAEKMKAVNININVTINSPGSNDIGGIIGSDSWQTNIFQYVDVSATIIGNENIGGMIGENDDGSIIYKSSFTGNLTGVGNVGGFIGQSFDTPMRIYSSFSQAIISGNHNLGGFVGLHNYRTLVQDSFVTGTITSSGAGQNSVGGFWGNSSDGGDIIRSYSSMTINSGGPSVGGAIGDLSNLDNAKNYVDSFVASDVQGNGATNSVSLFLGRSTTTPITGSNFFYWSGATCINSGAGSCNTDQGTGVADLTDFYDRSKLPLLNWNFNDVWNENMGTFPTLKNQSIYTPAVTHSCSTTANVSVLYNCSPVITDLDTNETQFIVLQKDHTCTWLQYSDSVLEGTPSSSGSCQVSFLVTDGKLNSSIQRYNIAVNP